MQRVRTLTIVRRVAKTLLVLYGAICMQTSLLVFLDVKDVTALFLPGASPAWVIWRGVYFFIQSVGCVVLGFIEWRLFRDDEYARRVALILDLSNAVFTRVIGPFRIVLASIAFGFVLQFIDETAQQATIFAPFQLALWLAALVLLIVGIFPIPLPATEIQGRKVIRTAFLRALVYTDSRAAIDQRFGPRARLELADRLATFIAKRTNYVGSLSVILSDPQIADGRAFVINSQAIGDAANPSPQGHLLMLTIDVLEIIHQTLGYEGRASLSFSDLPRDRGNYVACRGLIFRSGTDVIFAPDSDLY